MHSKSKKTLGMEGYSGQGKFTQTFFHHPTPNPHSTTDYEARLSKKEMKTFRTKKTAEYQDHLYQSSLNPLARSTRTRNEKMQAPTGQAKRKFEKTATDPILLSRQPTRLAKQTPAPFESSIMLKEQAERRDWLPVTRQLSQSRKHYHSQLGLSSSKKEIVAPREHLNNSASMHRIIQYVDHPQNRTRDDFKFDSRR